MKRSLAVPLFVVYALATFIGATGLSVALDQLERKGVIDLPETNPVCYAMERYAEKIEYIFATNKSKFLNNLVKERIIEGYKYSDYCEKYCNLVTTQVIEKPGYPIPPFCKAYCQNKYNVPEVPPDAKDRKDCPLVYNPVVCGNKIYSNLCFAIVSGEDPSKCERIKIVQPKPEETPEKPPEPIPNDRNIGLPEKIRKEYPKYGIPGKIKPPGGNQVGIV